MLNTMTTEEVEQIAKVTDSYPEETSRMRKWLAENIAAGKASKLGHYVRVTMTPVLAQLLLDKNSLNRPISARHVQTLASDISANLWQFNSQPIIVSRTGELLDGQHRCAAVISIGVGIDTLMSFGADDAARYVMDVGRPKSAANFLAMNGKSYSTVVASAVGYYLQYQRRGYVLRGAGSEAQWVPTKAEIVAAASSLKGFDASVDFTKRQKHPLRCHSVLAMVHYLFKKRGGAAAADEFMLGLLDADLPGLRKGHPVWFCREKLLRMTGRGTETNHRLEVLIKCWNAWRDGRTLDSIRIQGGKLPKVEA